MSVQFSKFFIEPFIHHYQLISAGRILIIIDGLDECDQSRAQRELLRLISNFCLAHPSSPVIWMIASRPEPHITSFFAQTSVEEAYEKEEIPVDSDEACQDVERFLHFELRKIQKEFSIRSQVPWPSEQDFWKLADASGGLFVYAQTVIKYIGNPDIGDPTAQLNDVLQFIDAHPLSNVRREEHPMALLDALYSRIMSKVPTKVSENTRKLLLALVVGWGRLFYLQGRRFIVLCNWLGITCDEVYAALRHLNSVLYIPGDDKAHEEELRHFHKSFIEYLSDFSRSGFSRDAKHEAHELYVQCTFRILEQAPDVGDLNYEVQDEFLIGVLSRGPGSGTTNIALTWPVVEENDWDDNTTRLYMYKFAFGNLVSGIWRGQQAFYTVFCIRLFAERLEQFYALDYPHLHEMVFEKNRRELREGGLLQKIPIKMFRLSPSEFYMQLQFRHPITPAPNNLLSDPWNPFCKHERDGEWGKGKDRQVWSTSFVAPGFKGRNCNPCYRRLQSQLEKCRMKSPDYPVWVLFTSSGIGFVEFWFVDLEDGVSQWRYWFQNRFVGEERRGFGS